MKENRSVEFFRIFKFHRHGTDLFGDPAYEIEPYHGKIDGLRITAVLDEKLGGKCNEPIVVVSPFNNFVGLKGLKMIDAEDSLRKILMLSNSCEKKQEENFEQPLPDSFFTIPDIEFLDNPDIDL